jgi:subtilase family serine protease
MRLVGRPARAGVAAALGLALAVTGGLAATASASTPAAGLRYVALADSTVQTNAPRLGTYTSSRMSVEVSLAPRDESGLNARLSALYTKGNRNYHHWLVKGQFDKLYAPASAKRTAVEKYLAGHGLRVQRSASPFLVRAVGSSQQVSAAFGTTLNTYREPGQARFFANSGPVRLPATLAPGVVGVVGLTNTMHTQPADDAALPSRGPAHPTSSTSCETPYPTAAQQEAFVTSGTLFPFGYGDGPGCSGLTPSQVNSIYGAPDVGASGKGAGVTVGIINFSGYESDAATIWGQEFYGSGYIPSVQNVEVDGGPVNPDCPTGDPCPASGNGYLGDVEGDLDIQRVLAVAPDAKIVVYQAPNDTTGQTNLDVYTEAADADAASTVTTSFVYPECGLPESFFQAEGTIFEQMATQGQGMFSASGDWGAVGCSVIGGGDQLNVIDPASQPWVTGVGGTSFEGRNPGTNSTPGYPANAEQAWDSDNLCQVSSTVVDGQTGYEWCDDSTQITGGGFAGGGGSSQYWGMPWWQSGTGVISSYTTYGNGSTNCAEAADGTACREVPDVSMDADTYTGYATNCGEATASDANSECYALESEESVPGWFSVAGTSSASPLWAGIAADMDSHANGRLGFLNPLLYQLLQIEPSRYFNDITGAGQTITSDGYFPTTPGYDEATGIGSPKMAMLITSP